MQHLPTSCQPACQLVAFPTCIFQDAGIRTGELPLNKFPYPCVITDDDYQRDQEQDEYVDEDKVFRGIFVLLTDDTGNIVGPV